MYISVKNMKIRYLKTNEIFQLVVPDPLDENNVMVVEISDYDLVCLIKTGKQKDLDDDTYKGIIKLRENYVLSINTLKQAKRQAHLRKLNRVETAWLELNDKKRSARNITETNRQRIEYLKQNEQSIIENCVKHDWFEEFYNLMRDLYPGLRKPDIIERWRSLKK